MPANYILLERIELNASAASVTFSNIPQSGYTDLKIVTSARTTHASDDAIVIAFNGSSSTYSMRRLDGNGSTATSDNNTTNIRAVTNDAGKTANTFGSWEAYIPNYTSSNFKSVSIDAVSENNATAANAQLVAGLWSTTSAITSMVFTSYNSANFVQYSTFSLYGLAAVGTTPAIAPKASGGNITTDGTYWIHTFLTSGTFTPATSLTCDYLVVAGGGGGGNSYGGGGGAGGFKTANNFSISASFTVTVGAGGAGAAPGTNGGNSVFSTITSNGGGGGGAGNPQSLAVGPTNGGSGGGVGGWVPSTNSTTTPVGTGISGQGNNGGNSSGTGWKGGGGGGGASAAGATGTNNGSIALGGAGGAGTASSITGASVTYAGGGGSGAGLSGADGTAGLGGAGGGGNGSNTGIGSAGTANTGGGGGGGDQNGLGGNGGSGIVIIRYPIA